MADYAIKWDEQGEKLYETGTRMGVLYPYDETQNWYGDGVAWNGLTAVSESPSGAEETALYADDQKYLSLYSAEEFGATVEAYTYPDEWAECDGSAEIIPGMTVAQQNRKSFAMCYRTVLGNDTLGEAYGYKLHLIYGARASASDKSYATINDSPDAITFSWEIKTTPIDLKIPGNANLKRSACITIDSSKFAGTASKAKLEALEQILYGTAAVEADAEHNISAADAVPGRMPTPAEVYNTLSA